MDQKQYESMLSDAELRLKRLRVLYDHWFHGIERVEPQNQRAEVDRMIMSLRREPQRNTALRFRFNQLVQRYTTFNTYWQRISRQIEEGTYKRDVARAQRRVQGTRGEVERGAADGSFDVDVEIGEAEDELGAALSALRSVPPEPSGAAPSAPLPISNEARHSSSPPRDITPFAHPGTVPGAPVRPAVPASATALPMPPAGPPRPPALPPAARKPPPPPPPIGVRVAPAPPPSASGNGMSEGQLQRIYDRYVEARKNNAERVDNVKLETIAKTVRDMMPKLQQKHAGKQIDFEVVVKDGRVALKPVAK
jgi:hypothetical protein